MIKFLNQIVPPLLKIVIISANHTDPDVLLHSAPFQLANILSRSYRKTMVLYIARFSIYDLELWLRDLTHLL